MASSDELFLRLCADKSLVSSLPDFWYQLIRHGSEVILFSYLLLLLGGFLSVMLPSKSAPAARRPSIHNIMMAVTDSGIEMPIHIGCLKCHTKGV